MTRNEWKKLGRVRTRPVSVIVVLVILIIFFSYVGEKKEAGTDAEQTEEHLHESTEMVEMPEAGVTLDICAAMAADTYGAVVETQSRTIVETADIEAADEWIYLDDIPLSREYQEYFEKYCDMYGCPLGLALATADIESGFDMSAVGDAGEVGMMQIHGGSSDRYFAAYMKETGLDSRTAEGNIACGCYLLAKYMMQYEDTELASMVYNMGETGAARLWEQGIYSTEYTKKVMYAYKIYDAAIYRALE